MTVRSIEHRTKVPEIRKGDTVVVLAGQDAGKRGKVEHVIRRDPSPTPVRSGYRRTSLKGGVFVVVEGLNIARKHTKPRQRSPGGLGSMPTIDPGRHPRPRDAAPREPRDDRVQPLRPADPGRRTATLDNGTRVRVCKHCGEPLEVKS